MSQYVFGSGNLYGTPTADGNGNPIALPTPHKFGALQDVSLDLSFDTKMLYGSNQFPLAVGRGKGKITGKAAFAQINGSMWNDLFFGQSLSSGILGDYTDTGGVLIPASTPYTITVAPPSSGTYVADLGVVGSTGLPMTRVTSSPTTGQYSVSVSTGVYTFAAADTGLRVFINYQFSTTVASAKTGVVQNLPMGYAPTFQADLQMPYAGKFLTISLPCCLSTKLGIATKLDDFMIPQFEFDAFANGTGQIMTYAMSDA